MIVFQLYQSIDWKLTSEVWRNWGIFLSSIFAAGTFLWSVYEKRKENKLNRFSTYLNFEQRLNSDKKFQKLTTYLENDDPKLASIDPLSKYKYLGFLEEVAIATDNKLISKELAFYMFGYYAIKAKESENFNYLPDNGTINWEAIYWKVIKKFVTEMKIVERQELNKTSPTKIKI